MVFWFGKSNESNESTTPSSSKTHYRRKIRATPPPPVAVPPSSPPPNDDDEEERTRHHERPPHWKSTLTEDQQARDVVERLKQDGVNAANSQRKDKKMELINKKRNESKTTATMSINTGNETAEIPSIRTHEKGLFSVAPPFPEHKRAAADSDEVDRPSGKKSRTMDDDDDDDGTDERGGGIRGWLGANGVALSVAVAISAIIVANLVRKK